MGFAGNGETEGGYFEDVRGGEMRWAAFDWLLVGREVLMGICEPEGWVLNGFGTGSVGVFMSGGL